MNQFRLFRSLFLFFVGLFGFWVGVEFGLKQAWPYPSLEEFKREYSSSEAQLLDRHGAVLQEVRLNSKVRQLNWTSLAEISPALIAAVIQSEDQHFWDHQGVDWAAMAAAMATNSLNLWKKTIRGGSTIPMQVVSMIARTSRPRFKRKTWVEKWNQISAARALSQAWTKEQILEAYLNTIDFRGELRGIASASYGIFGKAPHALDGDESLILAVLIRSPAASLTKVIERACALGKATGAKYSCARVDTLAKLGLGKPYFIPQSASLAPHLAHRLVKEASVRSTLDAELQKAVISILRQQLSTLSGRNVHDAAALVVDNRTGEVLSYVGSVEGFSASPYVDGVMALRQAGSTLKPFLYAYAIDKRYLTAASFLNDSRTDVETEVGTYRPQNYDRLFHGSEVSVRVALAASLNIPAVNTITLVGVDSFVQLLKNLGFQELRASEYYGPSLALGAVDIRLWDLVNAYRVLANEGWYSPLKVSLNSVDRPKRTRVFSSGASFILSDILSDRESRSLTFGLENILAHRFWTAVKTGTSKDMRDNWCIGYSSRYTVGVWAGNFSGEPMWNVSGMTGAAPAWAEVMRWLHQRGASRPPQVPKEVVKKSEWYLKGTEPESLESQKVTLSGPYRIQYPIQGLMIARDPDIPEESQKVLFEASPASERLKWAVNGQVLESGGSTVWWQPKAPGRYRVSLMDGNDKSLDQVTFTVK